MRKLVIGAVAGAAVAIGVPVLAYRVATRELPYTPAAETEAAVGVFHVHSDLSHDSRLTLAEIVAAARAADLDFVVLTDHNEQHGGPMVRDGVTVISSAEVSTPHGHVVQLGAGRTLERAARRDGDVHAAIRGVGGVPIVTHPTDPKRPWTGPWTGAGGLEIANFASSTRRRGGRAWLGLAPLLAIGVINPELSLVQLYDRDDGALALWDRNPDPSFVGLCGVDAHGWIDLVKNLRAWQTVVPGRVPEAEGDRPSWLLARLASGAFYCSAGLLGGAPGLRVSARRLGVDLASATGTYDGSLVDEVVATTAGALPGQTLVLFRNGLVVERAAGAELRHAHPAPGTYRVELWAPVPDPLVGEHLAPAAYSGRLRLAPEAGGPLPGAPP